jgi:hypothetical protein
MQDTAGFRNIRKFKFEGDYHHADDFDLELCTRMDLKVLYKD